MNLRDLYSELYYLIFDTLNTYDCVSLSLTCKNAYEAYRCFLDTFRSTRAGSSRLFPHQVYILEWIYETLSLNENAKMLCCAYMSAGKTIIGFETCFAWLSQRPDTYALIMIPPNVVNVWINEAYKHYRKLSTCKISNRKILFLNSTRSADQKYIRSENCNLNGKIVIATPSSSLVNVLANAAIVIFDECHRMSQAYAKIHNAKLSVPQLFLTASLESKELIPTHTLSILNKRQVFPTLEIKFLCFRRFDNIFSLLNTEYLMYDSDKKHVCILTNRRYIPNHIGLTTTRTIYDFNSRQVKSYAKYREDGGILLSSFKVISEGNNINHCETVYFVDPNACSLQTLQQCVGRFHRQSNMYSKLKIVFIVQQNSQNYARCRLSYTDYVGYDAKISDKICNIHKYLEKKKIDIDNLTDTEALCLYGTSISDKINDIAIELRQLSYADLINCMLC